MARGKKVLKLRAQAKVSWRVVFVFQPKGCGVKWTREWVVEKVVSKMDAQYMWSSYWLYVVVVSSCSQGYYWCNENGFVAFWSVVTLHVLVSHSRPLVSTFLFGLIHCPKNNMADTMGFFLLCSLCFLSFFTTEVQLQVPRHRCAANCHRQVLPCWGSRQREGPNPCQKPNQDQSFHHPRNCLDLVGWQIPRQACRCFEDSLLWFDPCLW